MYLLNIKDVPSFKACSHHLVRSVISLSLDGVFAVKNYPLFITQHSRTESTSSRPSLQHLSEDLQAKIDVSLEQSGLVEEEQEEETETLVTQHKQ